MKTIDKILVVIHFILAVLFVPYAFVAWIFGITPGVYYHPLYWINLTSIALYELSALVILISLLFKKARQHEQWVQQGLRIPFVFIAITALCLIYFLIKYWR